MAASSMQEAAIRRAVLFTGLIRNPEAFGRFLTALEALDPRPDDLQILLSTWDGELARYPEIAERLKALGAIVLEQPQPNLVLTGHLLHQMASLDLAITLLDDDVFLLKTRPDLCSPGDLPVFLNTQPIPVPSARPMPSPFTHRVGVVGAFGAHPFYINDITFIAMAADIRNLVRLPFSYLLRYVRVAPEQLYWGGPFIDRSVVLDAFFRANFGLIFGNDEQYQSLRAALTESPLYAQALAVAALTMRDNFFILNGDPDRAAVRDACRPHTVEALLWDTVDIPHVARHPSAWTNSWRSLGVWDALIAGDHAPSPLGARLREALTDYDQPDGAKLMAQRRSELRTQSAALGNQIEETVRQGRLKYVGAEEGRYVVARRDPEWTMAQTGTAFTVKLEEEINMLRRLVNTLQQEIAEKPSTTNNLQ